jgi:hypothetical protein
VHPFYFDDDISQVIDASPDAYKAVRERFQNVWNRNQTWPVFSDLRESTNKRQIVKLVLCIHPDRVANYPMALRNDVKIFLDHYSKNLIMLKEYIVMQEFERDHSASVLYNGLKFKDVRCMVNRIGKTMLYCARY